MARRLSPEKRRAEILATTMTVIAEKGSQGVSLREIARECGMSAPGLMHYFPDLESLLLAVLDYRDAIDLDALGQPLTEPGGLRSYLDRVVRYNSERPEAARIYAMLQAESLNAEHAARSYFRRRTNSFVDEFARGLEDVSDEPRMLAQGIVAVLDGLQLHWLSNPEEFDLNRQWEALADLILPRTRDRP